MGRLFGTDGVRGIANKELTCEIAMQLGRAIAMVIGRGRHNKYGTVVIGMDTRLSSGMLASAISAGFCCAGMDVINLGVVPTPAVVSSRSIHPSFLHSCFRPNIMNIFSHCLDKIQQIFI